MPSFLTMFTRSRLYANLTPGERAFLRFCAVLLSGAFLSGVQAVIPMLNAASPLDPSSVPWDAIGHTFLTTFALAVWLGIGKYRSAQGDPPLSASGPQLGSQSGAPTPAAPAGAAPAAPSYPAAPPAPPASTLYAAPPAVPIAPPVAG